MVEVARSRSVRLLAAVLAAGALVAAATNGPAALRGRQEVVDVQPGMLVADREAKGIITLGEGVTVSLYAAGLRIEREDVVLFQTVHVGSPVSAGLGSVSGRGGQRKEHVDTTLDNLRITRVVIGKDSATYRGELSGGERTLPVTIKVTRAGQGVEIVVHAQGTDLLVLHTGGRPDDRGVAPALPTRLLHGRVWWLGPQDAGVQPVTRGHDGSRLGVDLASDTVLDLRHGGRGEIHVWDSTLRMTVN